VIVLSFQTLPVVLAPELEAVPVTYLYEGRNFEFVDGPYATSMNIIGSFTVSNPIPSLAFGDVSGLLTDFSFFDGIFTYASTNPDLFIGPVGFNVATDASGMIIEWDIDLGIGFPFPAAIGSTAHGLGSTATFDSIGLSECTIVDPPFCTDSQQVGGAFVEGRGTWSVQSSVPEPATAVLTAFALVGLSLARRRRH